MPNKEIKRPEEFGYVGGENFEISSEEFMSIKGAIDAFLAKETSAVFPEKYKYINRETNETIKTVNEKNKHIAMKIVDVENTLQSQPVIQRTEEGVRLLEIRMMLDAVHLRNVESGVAKHIPTLQAEAAAQANKKTE